jgi:hypothetical protein
VLAAAIGVDRLAEADIRRIIAGNDRARPLFGNLRLERALFFLLGGPAVVERLAQGSFETALHEGARSPKIAGVLFGIHD